MSKQIGKLPNNGPKQRDLTLCQFWGGHVRGICLQLTGIQEDGGYGYIQLTAAEIIELLPVMQGLVQCELQRVENQFRDAMKEASDGLKAALYDRAEVAKLGASHDTLKVVRAYTLGGSKLELDKESSDD
jgi:hypothetical protein